MSFKICKPFSALPLCLFSLVLIGCGSSSTSTGTQTPTNPTPTLASLSPNTAPSGSGDTTVTLTGTNFLTASEVMWNGSELARTYVSSTSLTAVISASNLTIAGKGTITVVNPSPGGGTSSGVSFAVTTPANPVPTLTSISPASATAGSAATTIALTGTNFLSTSSIMWNSTALTTTYTSATSLSASVPANLVATAGTAAVAVLNPAPGGGASSTVSFTITAIPTGAITSVPILANDLAWDPVNQNIYLSLPSVDGANGNSVQILDPTTATLGASSFAGSEPNLLSVSANSKYLYVSLDGASDIQRLTLPSLAADIEIPLGPSSFYGPYYAMDLQAAPSADSTMAVVRGTPGVSPEEEGGVIIYDDGTARPNVLCGWIQIPACSSPNQGANLYDSIQWNADATEMYIANNEDTGFDFYTVPVTSSGFGTVTDFPGLVQGFYGLIHYDSTTKLVYDDNGVVIDPTAGSVVGTFNASGIMVPDGKLGTAFFLGQTPSNSGTTYTVESFDLHKFTPISTLTIPHVVGTPTHLVRWGGNGLAFTTVNKNASGSQALGTVYIVTGTFVGAPPAIKPAVPAENVKRSWPSPKNPNATQLAPPSTTIHPK